MHFSDTYIFIFPFLSQSVVDLGIMNNNLHFIYLVLAAQLILSFSELIIGFIQSWILLHVTSRISIALISDFMSLSYIIGQLKDPVSAFMGFVHSYQDAKISLGYYEPQKGDIMERFTPFLH